MSSPKRNDLCSCGSGLKYKKCCLHHKGHYTIYLDEAGNSGANYLDFDQPFYILGGWIIPNDKLSDTSIVTNLKETMNVQGELKGSKSAGKKRNQKIFSTFFNDLRENGFRQTLIFAEKKYCIAAKIVETFLDPYYNDKVSNIYTYDNVLKKQLAEKIYTLPDNILKEFAEAYRELKTEPMEKALNLICDFLIYKNEYSLADKLSGAVDYIEDNVISENNAMRKMPNSVGASLNLPVFVSLITKIEKYGRENNYKISVVHDETQTYESGYKQTYRLLSEADDFQFELTDGTNVLMGYNHLRRIYFDGSKKNLWLQSADILDSSINRFLKAVYNEDVVTPELLEISEFILPAISSDGIGDSICSDKTRLKINKAIKSMQ